MWKKTIGFMLVLVMVATLVTGCGNKVDPKDTQANIEGTMKSFNQILEETGGDATEFYNGYAEKEVQIEGTIAAIEDDYFTAPPAGTDLYAVTLEEGWTVQLVKTGHPEVKNMQVGDRVVISSKTARFDAAKENILMENIGIQGIGTTAKYNDHSTIVPVAEE